MIRKSYLAAAVALAVPAIAQVAMPGSALPGSADAARVAAGNYKVDTNHTQVVWTVNHMGLTPLSGTIGASGGTLALDTANPAKSKVEVTFGIGAVSTPVAHFTEHLQAPEILDAAKFPIAKFVSTSVVPNGAEATITGDFTFHGVTKPVTLKAKFFGAGANPNSKKDNIGFTATATIKRSDFGVMYAPTVGDEVNLDIRAGFEKIA